MQLQRQHEIDEAAANEAIQVWALGFGLWALGFGLWALGFGV